MAWLSGREKAEELIMIAFRWLATVDQFMCLRTRTSKGRPGPFTLQKVQNLLAGMQSPEYTTSVQKLHSNTFGLDICDASDKYVEEEPTLPLWTFRSSEAVMQVQFAEQRSSVV